MRKMICIVSVIAILTTIGVVRHNIKPNKTEINIKGVMPHKTESEMILDSDLIVCGKVKKIKKSKWSNKDFERGEEIRNILQTDIVINVEKVLSGECDNSEVIVRIDKGEDENTIVYSEGYPDFTKGEEVLLFLSRDDSDVATDEDYYVLTGMKQGKYNINNAATSEKAATKVFSNGESSIDIQTLKVKIKEEKTSNPNYKEKKEAKQQEIEKQNEQLFGK